MSSLDNIVHVNISRATQSVAKASFGVFGIISEFPTSKTTAAFDRYREYAGTDEMSNDGWDAADAVYQEAVKVFSQNPKVDKIMVGRKDSADSDWDDALTEIKAASSNWYCFAIITNPGNVVFDSDFVASNDVVFTVNGVVVTTVPYNTSQGQTMTDIKTAIEADVAGSTVTLDGTRGLFVEVTGGLTDVAVSVSGGASQPDEVITFADVDDVKAVALWTETQIKIFSNSSNDTDILDSGSSTDIAAFLESQNYDRSMTTYMKEVAGNSPSFIEGAWPGECLPYDAGSQTWAFKTLSAVTAYELTSAQRTAALDKNCNIYTSVAGVDVTEQGKVAGGEYIDVIRGIDWLVSQLQEEIFTNLINVRKVPYTDGGITVIAGIVEGVLNAAADAGILVKESIVLSVPKVEDIPDADKSARNLPDVDFTATLQGAIQKVTITGTVTV